MANKRFTVPPIKRGLKRWQKFALAWLMFSGPAFGILAALVKDWLF